VWHHAVPRLCQHKTRHPIRGRFIAFFLSILRCKCGKSSHQRANGTNLSWPVGPFGCRIQRVVFAACGQCLSTSLSCDRTQARNAGSCAGSLAPSRTRMFRLAASANHLPYAIPIYFGVPSNDNGTTASVAAGSPARDSLARGQPDPQPAAAAAEAAATIPPRARKCRRLRQPSMPGFIRCIIQSSKLELLEWLGYPTHWLDSFMSRSIPWSDDSGKEAVVLFIAEHLAGEVR